MIGLVWNILLALAWTAMTGRLSAENLLLGMLIGFIVLSITQQATGRPSFTRRAWSTIMLVIYVAYELVLSNIRVAIDVLKPTRSLRSVVIDVPLDARTDAEITLLAAVITLTPGTTAIAVSPDRGTMYVHMVNLWTREADQARDDIKQGFERRVLEVLR